MTDTRPNCGECNGRGVDGWGGTCCICGGQGREPFRYGKEDDEDQVNEDPLGQQMPISERWGRHGWRV